MTSVFLLTTDPAAASVLARGLPRDRFRVTVGVLGPVNGPAADELRAAGVPVSGAPIRHALDVNGARRLRQAAGEAAPAVIHAVGPQAARVARLLVAAKSDGGNAPALVVSETATPGSGIGGWLTTRQLRRADRVVAATWADGERYRRLGVRAERLTHISPAAPPCPPEPDRAAVLQRLGVPPDARLVVTGARTDRGIGPKDAIVAFDMLRYEARDLRLAVFGAGEGAASLEHFGRALAFDDFRIHFPPNPADRAAAACVAAAVWVTAPRDGTDEALEAMAAGKPVVAWGTPELTEIIDDGVTGLLVPTGDRAALAAKGRVLIEDAEAAARMGGAGQARATGRFPAARMVEQYARVYLELKG